MWLVSELRQLFHGEPLQNRIAYVLMLLLALLYLLSQVGMAVLWIVGQAQLDNV
jgi:hypothetical protein